MSDMTMPHVAKERPKSVIGPDGKLLSLDDLPPPNTQRWVARRKAEVVAAVRAARDANPGLPLTRDRVAAAKEPRAKMPALGKACRV